MFRIILLALVTFTVFNLKAQTEEPIVDTTKNWKFGGNGSFTLTQASQKNWIRGGEAAFSFLGTLELKADYAKDKHMWENYGIFSYGQQRIGDQKYNVTSDDRIEITSKYGYEAGKNLYYSALLGMKSQFANGYDYIDDSTRSKVSEFMSPGYLSASLGLDYKPIKNLSIFCSPASLKSTYVLDTINVDQTVWGLDSISTSRHELGAFIKAKYLFNVYKVIDVENNLELFSNYLHEPQNIDVTWDLKIIISATKYLKTVFSSTLIYDHDIAIPDPTTDNPDHTTQAIQFKQMLSVGLMYSF